MAPPGTTYRRATLADAASIATIIAEVASEPDPVAFDQPFPIDKVERWITRLGDQGSLFVAVVPDGTIAGFSALDYSTEEPDTAMLGVWVRRTFRRQGIGTALAECALDFAREAGYKRVRGRLPAHNEAALSFLSSIGALVPLRNPDMRFELPLS
jgi:ribosomal protein S18 acetylase RimI-like enzyme